MRRLITVYAFLISVISVIALLALAAFSTSLAELWRNLNPDKILHPMTMNAPLIARVGMVIPGLLLVVSIFSFKRGLISDRLLTHGIGITALALAAIAIFVVVTGLMPSIVTIIEVPNP